MENDTSKEEKLVNPCDDLRVLMRKEDIIVNALIELLADRKIITVNDKKQLLSM